MKIETRVADASEEICRSVLKQFLSRFLDPAFGALPKSEIELLVLDALVDLDYVSGRPSLYELTSRLKVTRTKARSLLYARELRRIDEVDLERLTRDALTRPLIQKQGNLFAIEIENPVVADHLRHRLQELGHATDGSFSASLVKITLDAYVSVVDSFFSADDREKMRQALVDAGAPDRSFKGVLKGALKKLASKLADEAGAAVAGDAVSYLEPIVNGAFASAAAKIGSLFSEGDST